MTLSKLHIPYAQLQYSRLKILYHHFRKNRQEENNAQETNCPPVGVAFAVSLFRCRTGSATFAANSAASLSVVGIPAPTYPRSGHTTSDRRTLKMEDRWASRDVTSNMNCEVNAIDRQNVFFLPG